MWRLGVVNYYTFCRLHESQEGYFFLDPYLHSVDG
jgi:hypothetical protein